MFSRTELFPEDCAPTTTIWGSSTPVSPPSRPPTSWSRPITGMSFSPTTVGFSSERGVAEEEEKGRRGCSGRFRGRREKTPRWLCFGTAVRRAAALNKEGHLDAGEEVVAERTAAPRWAWPRRRIAALIRSVCLPREKFVCGGEEDY
jgi:hypothetical protein